MIEVIDGHVIFCHSGSAEHSNVARRLATRLEAARPADPRTSVATDVDVYVGRRRRSDAGLSFRRPGVSVCKCTERGSKPSARDVLMAVEVVSPGSGASRAYRLAATHDDEELALEEPFPFAVLFSGPDG